jgi:UDP-N-acetylglucosamine 1-carboxyvinyltransferase
MQRDSFEVIGGQPLKGELIPQGAKNEALQVISAVLLTNDPVTISNIPDILDVNKLIELLKGLGVTPTVFALERLTSSTCARKSLCAMHNACAGLLC